MRKHLAVFSASWSNEFTYRLNFILWRVRNLLRFLMTYFLWIGVFAINRNLFGYSQSQMLTYVFMVLIVQTVVLAAPSNDNIGSEIGSGDLSNYLVKPIGYLKYWFTRDVSSKVLNMLFASFELAMLWALLHPTLTIPSDFLIYLFFGINLLFAVGLYYLLSVCARFMAFWAPENTWGLAFLLLVFIEVLAGGIFPLNILPNWAYNLLQLTPFPYLVYFPIAIFAGKIVGWELLRITLQSGTWLIFMLGVTKFIWGKGLVNYQSNGR